jgi:hypothetical protein
VVIRAATAWCRGRSPGWQLPRAEAYLGSPAVRHCTERRGARAAALRRATAAAFWLFQACGFLESTGL